MILTVNDFSTGEAKFSATLTNLGIQSGRIYAEMSGSFMPSLPIERGKIYRIGITDIEGQADISLGVLFEDYLFTAGGTGENGVAVLNNRLQFRQI